MDVKTVKSLADFVERIELFDLLTRLVIFRGQPMKGDLLPAIARDDPAKDTTEDEKELLRQLSLQGASLLQLADDDRWGLLAAAQHFGLKTRLLDWTSNPLAALWFAVTAKQKGDVYVYALIADDLQAEGTDPFAEKKTRVYQPRMSNPRIIAQHGWFTVHRFSNKSRRFVPLEKNPDIKPCLYAYKIPENERTSFVASLDRHGINSRTLFPDLGGLCQYLNWRYVGA